MDGRTGAFPVLIFSAIPIDWYSCSMDHFGIVAAKEQDDTRDVLGLRPLRKIRAGHCFPIYFSIDDAGQDSVTDLG